MNAHNTTDKTTRFFIAMGDSFLDSVLNFLNEVRATVDAPPLLGIHESELNHSFANEVIMVEESRGGTDENGEAVIISALQRLLQDQSDESDEQTNANYRALLNSNATHLSATIDMVEEGFSAKLFVVNKYFELDPVGPVIGGDIVLQGTFISESYGPALCKVEYLPDDDEEFIEIYRVYPWDILITHSDNEGEHDTFAIPIQLKTNYRDGTLKFTIYADDVSKIPYHSQDGDYKPHTEELICAIEYISRSADDEILNKKGVPLSREGRIVSSLQIVVPSGTNDESAQKGYISSMMSLTKHGLKPDTSAPWPIHLYVNHDSLGAEGVEDIIWVRAPKLIGILSEVPEGYEIMEDGEFSVESDEMSSSLAVKMGPEAVFKNIFMITCNTKTTVDAEKLVSKFLKDCGGGEYRPAPPEVCHMLGKPAGIIMITGYDNYVDKNAMKMGSENVMENELTRKHHDDDDEEMSRVTASDNDEDDDYDEFMFSNEQEILNALIKRINDLELDKERGKQQNSELQKKCAALLAKLDRNPGGGSRVTDGTVATEADTAANDNSTEKETHFKDTLQNIQEGRSKLDRQQSEFDQLSQDLQTRLDDKEYRANEISESFKAFKQDVLRRSEHSRTGRGVSQKLIEQFEFADQKKDEDLEKVRLRHISLKTQLRKLERSLRAREQLAEGLHMIDFEQLKIENQTLNEKIEERNEELAKLKRKKTNTVQVLTHYREKIRFVHQKNEILRNELDDVETTVAKQRSFLNTFKHEKDAVRVDNTELRRRQGFATNEKLTTDFDLRKSSLEVVKASIKELQERHFLLTRQITMNTEKTMKAQGMTGGVTLPSIVSKMY